MDPGNFHNVTMTCCHGIVPSIVLAINMTGVLLLKPEDKFILFEFPFRDIESILLDPGENFVTVTLHKAESDRQR